ncbi:6-phosphofructokinase (EC [uncultured Gammaproteobacteria bacterium]|nr:6-phosphofructokinase (EC [uncultured Gammaproteobacteria bacterium]
MVANLIKDALGHKYHWAVADYLQRAARHLSSKSDVEQAYALGEAAVNLAMEGKNSVMPAVIRTSNNPYTWEIGMGELKDIANVEKMMPMDYISDDGFGITDACREYLQPLIEGEDYPPYKNGLPDYVVMKKEMVEKKLPSFEV